MRIDIENLREQRQGQRQKDLFQHQIDAITALNRVFTFNDNAAKGALLVLPTGAGKTFTAVKWLNDFVIPKGIKILWLAHTFHLLDQAFETFYQNAHWIPERKTLNIRLISSHPSHEKVSSIDPLSDDIVIMTTQTAISNWDVDALDQSGNRVITNFRRFIESCKATKLCVILDEAHHAPAYGCRHLLMSIRESVPNVYILGLTATPTYTDETRRGWLKRIFEQEVIFEAKQADLIAQDILARPRFISMPTGREYPIDDRLYTRLVREHKDLPEEIIGRLAGDAGRNDYIVNEYVKHPEYGKTIIFADRWFQCVYLKGKLRDKGIKADAVYSHIDADPGSAEARNKQTSDDNKRILKKFKNGQGDDALDVLINVRMLTEGTDVPSIKTAFITRQTTSPTLMTQMIGRALRGKKAGGGDNKDEANIVFFVDEWKQLINWATPSLEGGVDDSKRVRGYYPLEYISIRLVEELTKQINLGIVFPDKPFLHILPVGWYQTEIVVNTSEENNDEMQSFAEFVMVYGHTKPKFEKFMNAVAGRLPDDWAKEYLSDEWMRPWVTEWIGAYFDKENDNIGNTLDFDLIRIARHIAQKQTAPVYYPFEERDEYDLDKLAAKVLQGRYDDFAQEDLLENYFIKPGSLWKTFYRSLDRFKTAFYGAKQRQLNIIRGRPISPLLPPPIPPRVIELTEGEKEQIKKHDGNTCQACGAHGRGIKLEIDHIIPVQWGGKTSVDNSQTLCSVCNKEKGINEINFRNHVTLLGSPKELVLLPRHGTEDVKQSITRLVNFFYHCKAVCQVRLHQRRSGSHYSIWEIELYPGNNPEWLLQHKQALITHIQNKFRCAHVKNIRIISAA